MTKINTSQVFGVSKDMVLSYLERDQVDGHFRKALESDRHIVIYGASKQGKSALLQKHVRKDDTIQVSCTLKSDAKSIYSSILRQIGVEIETQVVERKGSSGQVAVKTSFKAKIPFFGEGTGGVEGQISGTSGKDVTYKIVEFNLELAQDVSEILDKTGFKKFVVIDNFHYLDEKVQETLAFDLRLFQEKGYRFIILGVWREKNRLSQFNGDILDRIIEIPVEPWTEPEFMDVISKGCKEFNISISGEIVSKIIAVSFGSIGIVQELCKEICFAAGIQEKDFAEHIELTDTVFLDIAIAKKVEEYSSRHMRALESIATSGIQKDGLYMPYYVVRTVVEIDAHRLLDGISRADLQQQIKLIHYRPEDVRPGDMTYVLHGLAECQQNKMVVPPLFDYDRVNGRLRIIDSTLFFFLSFKNKQELLDEIPNPLDNRGDTVRGD